MQAEVFAAHGKNSDFLTQQRKLTSKIMNEKATADEKKSETMIQNQGAKIANIEEELPPLTLWQMIGSVLSAAVGVQSKENRERDFARGKASHFIMVGVGFTILFVILMATLVGFILDQVT